MELAFPDRSYTRELGLVSQGPSRTNSPWFGDKKPIVLRHHVSHPRAPMTIASLQVLISSQTTHVIQRSLRYPIGLLQAFGKQGRGQRETYCRESWLQFEVETLKISLCVA